MGSRKSVLLSRIFNSSYCFGSSILDFLMPPSCIICEQAVLDKHALCARCWRTLCFITKPYCSILGTPFAYDLGNNIVGAAAIANPPPFEKARSAVIYNKPARRIIARFKYEDRPDLANILAQWMQSSQIDLIDGSPVVVPIPLHYWRLLQRRYNQSALLARVIAYNNHLNYCPQALIRVRYTSPQVGLTLNQRITNVRGAFKATPSGVMCMSGRVVLLIDDVYTTGATINAATQACLRAGAKAVRVLTFARVGESFDPIATDSF